MRALLPLLLLVAGCAAPPGGGGGAMGGIVSLNPCADVMLVRLVPPGRIAAISHYSQSPGATSIPLALARRFRATAGTAEEVIALRPGLVVASSFTPPPTRDAFARAGLRTLYLDAPQTIEGSVAQVRELAAAVGATARGEAMAAAIGRAATPAKVARRPAALLYFTGDTATGGGTLLDAMLVRAGFRNAAADYGLTFTGTLPAETLVARPPAIVIAPPAQTRGAVLRRRLLPATRTADFAPALVNCGGPTIVAAMARLRAIRATL